MIPRYRAWDKKNKCWTNYAIIDNMQRFYDKHIGDWLYEDKDWLALMQSTGLKDKNGVEIYIGDIVRGVRPATCDESKIVETIGIVKEDYCEVVIEDSKGTYDPFINYFVIIYQQGNAEIEVIGNIYENPELMEM